MATSIELLVSSCLRFIEVMGFGCRLHFPYVEIFKLSLVFDLCAGLQLRTAQLCLSSFSKLNIRPETVTWEREQRVLFQTEASPPTPQRPPSPAQHHHWDLCQCGSTGPETMMQSFNSVVNLRGRTQILNPPKKKKWKKKKSHRWTAEACHITHSLCALAAERREECMRLCKRVGVESSWCSLQPDTGCPWERTIPPLGPPF